MKNSELDKLALEKQTSLRNLFFLLLVVILILVLVIFSRFRIKKKANRILNVKNNFITRQKDQLTNTLNKLREVHQKLEEQKEELVVQTEELEVQNTEISSQSKELREVNATKDKFFSIIAHDLKNPFNVILGFSNLLSTEYENYEDDERKKIINEIERSANSTYKLLVNLLTWSRSQRGKIEISKKVINLSDVVKSSMSYYSPNARKKEIAIINNIDNGTTAYADINTLEIIIGNILNNAIKYTPEDGQITLTAEIINNYSVLSIKDNGIGMSQETIDKLFRIEENHSMPGTNNEKGTGLGLILCKDFIKKNGGKITVNSKVDIGSEFKIWIPNKE
jgi:signal transduction histidine kinase